MQKVLNQSYVHYTYHSTKAFCTLYRNVLTCVNKLVHPNEQIGSSNIIVREESYVDGSPHRHPFSWSNFATISSSKWRCQQILFRVFRFGEDVQVLMRTSDEVFEGRKDGPRRSGESFKNS